MLENAHAELNPQIAAAIEALRAKSKKKIDRAYSSYGSGHGKRTWHETVKHARGLAEATEAEVAALIASASGGNATGNVTGDAEAYSTEADSTKATNAEAGNVADEASGGANGAGTAMDVVPDADPIGGGGKPDVPGDTVADPETTPSGAANAQDGADASSVGDNSESGEKVKRKRRKRMTAAADNQQNAGCGAATPDGESGGNTTAPTEVASVRSLDDEALLPEKLRISANRLLKEIIASHRAAIHLAVTTGKLTNPPQPGDTKDRYKEGAHALFNLWMTRSLAAQDAALEKISLWEKSLTAFLHVQVQDRLFGVASSERERVVEPYDIVFRRVRNEKLRITGLIQREHDTFQGTLQGALRKRIAAIEADASIPSEKKKGRKVEPGAESEEEVAVESEELEEELAPA